MRWLRERSSTYSRRQPKGGTRWGDVSGGGPHRVVQATRPPSRGSASPETEVGTDDLGPMWGHSRSGLT